MRNATAAENRAPQPLRPSFRVGSYMLVEQDGRLHLKRLSIQGTGGQCLMGPPDLVDGRIPYRLYNLGGALANTLVALVAAALAFALPQRLATIFFAFLALVGENSRGSGDR